VCGKDSVGVYTRFVMDEASRGCHATVQYGEAPDGSILKTYHNAQGAYEDEVHTVGCGTYRLCFENQMKSSAAPLKIEVDYFQVLHKPGDTVPGDAIPSVRASSSASKGMLGNTVGEAEAKVSALNNWVQLMREEVKHLKNRAHRHKSTVESNSRRMVRTTMIEVFVLIGVAGVQVITVRRFFDVQTSVHARKRAAGGGASMYRNSFAEGAFANGIAGVTRMAGPMADAAQRGVSGVAGLVKSLGKTPQKSSYHLG